MNINIIKKIFPHAIIKENDKLPIYVERRGTRPQDPRYDTSYLFIGNAKKFDIENISDKIWNEQLIPWPWFILMVSQPKDNNKNLFIFILVDENGSTTFHVSKQFENEIYEGVNQLKKEALVAGPPSFIRKSWLSVMTKKLWQEYVPNNGKLITSQKETL